MPSPGTVPFLNSWCWEGILTLILAAPRGARLLPLGFARQKSALKTPHPPGLPSPGLGSPQYEEDTLFSDSGAIARLLPPGPRQGERGFLTSHHIHVRQSWGGFQRRRRWERGYGSRERRVGHLQDQ